MKTELQTLDPKDLETVVVFRKVPGNYCSHEPEVIALFPCVPGNMDARTCLSYVHCGQHSAAMASGHNWPLATPEEYAPLKAELESIGYVLSVKAQSCPAYCARRRAALS